MDIDVEKLIQVVKQHRVLYDSNGRDYYDRSKKKQLWEDVCAMVHSHWDRADENERILYCKEVQKKWQSLRDSFRRELVAQNASPGSNVKKKAKYKFYDALQFLTPFTQPIGSETSDHENEILSTYEAESSCKDPLSDSFAPSRKRKHSSTDNEITVVKEVTKPTDTKPYSADDEAFLQSLLPAFNGLTLQQKLLLRIELMKTILQFKQNNREMIVTMKIEALNDDNRLTLDV